MSSLSRLQISYKKERSRKLLACFYVEVMSCVDGVIRVFDVENFLASRQKEGGSICISKSRNAF